MTSLKPASGVVHTATQLQRTHRRLDRLRQQVDRVTEAMRHGCVLHMSYVHGRASWQLSNGQSVAADVAAIVTTKSCVASVGDALFRELPAQSWRFIAPEGEHYD
jgi:hypothetical protein